MPLNYDVLFYNWFKILPPTKALTKGSKSKSKWNQTIGGANQNQNYPKFEGCNFQFNTLLTT